MKENKPTPQQILVGGESLTVTTRDGQQVEVFVRQVKASELMTYLALRDEDEFQVIPFICQNDGQPVAADDLTLDSVESVLEADNRQNFTFAERRRKRIQASELEKIERMRKLAPEAYEDMIRMQTEAIRSSTSSQERSASESEAGKSAPAK